MGGIINLLQTFDGGVETRFVMEVLSSNSGTSGTDQFTIPTDGTGYNYTVETSDGYSASGITGDHTITFPSGAGTHDVYISGDFPRIFFNRLANDRNKLKKIKNWGNIAWTSFRGAFNGCEQCTHISAPDTPNLTNVTDMAFMFALSCYSGITIENFNWDVSNITNMNRAFYAIARSSNTVVGFDISNWDISNVTNLIEAFNIKNFTGLPPKQSIGNVSNLNINPNASVTTAFGNCILENIQNWNITPRTSIQGLLNRTQIDSSINNWNTSNITNMYQLLSSIDLINVNLSNWDFSSVTQARELFRSCTNIPNIENLNFSDSLNSLQGFLQSVNNFNQSLASYNIKNVTTLLNFMVNGSFTNSAYDATLIGFEATLQTHYPGGVGYTFTPTATFGSSKYTLGGAAETARTSLINNFNWNITDGGGI